MQFFEYRGIHAERFACCTNYLAFLFGRFFIFQVEKPLKDGRKGRNRLRDHLLKALSLAREIKDEEKEVIALRAIGKVLFTADRKYEKDEVQKMKTRYRKKLAASLSYFNDSISLARRKS